MEQQYTSRTNCNRCLWYDFLSCIDLTPSRLDNSFKMYSALTIANGQIRIRPDEKRGVKAFTQWPNDWIRVGENPSLIPFPIAQVPALIRRAKDYENFLTKRDTMSYNIEPIWFTKKIPWDKWKPALVNFLNTLPGINRVPLKYAIRDNNIAIIDPFADMLQDHINQDLLIGDAFDSDLAEVYTYLGQIYEW